MIFFLQTEDIFCRHQQQSARVFKVNHTDEQLEEELCSIVDMGGCVENVMINHRVYGHMEAELHINSRRKVMEFIGDIKVENQVL